MTLKYAAYLTFATLLTLPLGHVTSAGQTLTIRGSTQDSGDVIQLADDAQLTLSANGSGIVVTLPDVDVRLRCLGNPTAEGYCLLSLGDGSSIVDSDGDGVPNNKDLCFSTPSSSYVNSSGCSSAQLGGGDSNDNSGDDSNDNSGGDSNDNSGDDTGIVTTGYCSNKANNNVSCSSSTNFDNWWATRGDLRYTIPAGRILSIPFTARASNVDAAMFAYTTDQSTLNGYSWSSWVSTQPGGSELTGPCSKGGNEARGNFYLTQKPAQASECNLGTGGGVYYFNYRVFGSSGYYGSDYEFDVGRTAY